MKSLLNKLASLIVTRKDISTPDRMGLIQQPGVLFYAVSKENQSEINEFKQELQYLAQDDKASIINTLQKKDIVLESKVLEDCRNAINPNSIRNYN